MTKSSSVKIGLLQFPGSNCDVDCKNALREHFSIDVIPIWHTETTLPKLDGLIIPGGFSYGDYLRGGALASHSKIVADVKSFAARGGPIIGICNGFQILTEAGLLPGVLLRNAQRTFICKYTTLSTQSGKSFYQRTLNSSKINLPIAHGEGRYFLGREGLKKLHDNGQIVFTYDENPNGACDSIAGIVNEKGNVFGLMPHPERAMRTSTGGSSDGKLVWEAFLASCG